MLLEIFSSPIGSGAQLFFLIVFVLIGLIGGLSVMDARKTALKNKKTDED